MQTLPKPQSASFPQSTGSYWFVAGFNKPHPLGPDMLPQLGRHEV